MRKIILYLIIALSLGGCTLQESDQIDYYIADTTLSIWAQKFNKAIFDYTASTDTIQLGVDNFQVWSQKINYFIDSVPATSGDTIIYGTDNFEAWRTKFNSSVIASLFSDTTFITLIAGQSNVGITENTDIPIDSAKYNGVLPAFIYNRIGSTQFDSINTGVNTNTDFYSGIVVTNSFGHEVITGYNQGGYFIKSGRGSTGLSSSDWLGGDIYDSTLITISEAISEISTYTTPIINKIIWIQGERDAQVTSQANNYLNLLTTLFDSFDNDIDSIYNIYGQTSFEADKYIVKLNDSTYSGTSANNNVDTIQWAQNQYVLLNDNAHIIGCQECDYSNTHYSATGQIELGWRVLNNYDYNRETQKLMARMDSIPADSILFAISECIDSLKFYNYWDSTDVQYVPAAHDEQFAKTEWLDTLFNATFINNPTFTEYRGIKGDGLTTHATTNFNLLSNSNKFKLEDGCVHIYSRTNQSSSAVIDFGVNNVNFFMNTILRSGGSRTAANEAVFTITDGGIVESIGLFSLERKGDTVRYYHNGVEVIEYYQPAVAIPDGDMFFLAQNAGGTPASFSLKEISFFSITSSFDNYAKYFEIIERYLDRVGAGLIAP